MTAAIRVEGLGKRYQVRHRKERGSYRTLRESLSDMVRAPFWRSSEESDRNDFWALKDVSFEVQPGEVVGIIGRNGAGKSTLLKILSRITKPTKGRVHLNGRVGSLLEVGTGFHPELTGRENIYLNGSILGMSRKEIDRRFDEIVAFAEVERFLDTPVKRYSSGMYVRLAFAVAAHLNPEILVVDEVLAVGDQAFQKKCLGKMSEVSRTGRTVLIVSHQVAAIEYLCSNCLLFDSGQLEMMGDPKEVLTHYQSGEGTSTLGRQDLIRHAGRKSGSIQTMNEVVLGSEREEPVASVQMGSTLRIKVLFASNSQPISPVLGVVVKTKMGIPLFGVNNRFIPGYRFEELQTAGEITCCIERLPLMPGFYAIDLFFGNEHQDIDTIHEAITFEVTPTDVFGSGKLPNAAAGSFFWNASWVLAS